MTQAAALAAYGSSSPSNRNRIINGDMRIDQRNAGASVTLSGAEAIYPVDRFNGFNSTDGTVTAQQVAEAPAGFVNSSKLTVTVADASIGETQRTTFRHRIEGLNVSDLGWGTTSAQAVTLSFWVRSSVTGTHGGSLMNSSSDYSYPFTYAISVANTWEFKTVTIAGPTAGTWLTTNGIGLQVIYGLAMGSTFSGTAGAWAAVRYEGATGAVQITSTLNATWQITGVQLEAGSVATPFEHRQYGQELALCQRYYYRITGGGNTRHAISGNGGNTNCFPVVFFKTSMRATPSFSYSALSDFVIEGFAGGSGTPTAMGWNAGTTENATINSSGQSGIVGSGGNLLGAGGAWTAWNAEL